MTIITSHEAEQQAEMRKPLWATHPTCNGSCQQGRACDCTASVADDWEETQWQDEAWFWGGIVVSLGVLTFGAALMAGWRP